MDINGALEIKHETKHHIINNFNQTETFWYKNRKAENPDISVIHNQNTELILQSSWNIMGGVKAKTTIGINAKYVMYFFIFNGAGQFMPDPQEAC